MTEHDPVEILGKMFGFDDFELIAVKEILKDLEQYKGQWPPAADSDHERLLMELGAITSPKVLSSLDLG